MTFNDTTNSAVLCTSVPLLVVASGPATATCTVSAGLLQAGANTITGTFTPTDTTDVTGSTGTLAPAQQVVQYDVVSGLPYIGGSSGFHITAVYGAHSTQVNTIVVQVKDAEGACTGGCIDVWTNGVQTVTAKPDSYPITVAVS